MFSNIKKLFIADVNRLKKYNILQISIGLAFLYGALIYFTSADEAEALVPMLVFADVTMMSVILLGASLFFEKQEGSLKSLIVTPVTLKEIIISKVLSATLISFITAAIVSAVAIAVHSAVINVPLLLMYAVLGTAAHIMIGFVLVIKSRDFNTLLVNYIFYVIIFALPATFFMIGIIPSNYDFLIYISPSYVAQMLINTSIGIKISLPELICGIAYLITIIFVLFKLFVYKKFKEYIFRG